MANYADHTMGRPNPLTRAEAWLDQRGKGAWIAAMVVGFIAFWPVGLGVLAYMSFTGKWSMGGKRSMRHAGGMSFKRAGTGNAAFDAYRAETIRRLEDEQAAFESFLERLREARDKAEFDQFMDDRAKTKANTDDDPNTPRTDAA